MNLCLFPAPLCAGSVRLAAAAVPCAASARCPRAPSWSPARLLFVHAAPLLPVHGRITRARSSTVAAAYAPSLAATTAQPGSLVRRAAPAPPPPPPPRLIFAAPAHAYGDVGVSLAAADLGVAPAFELWLSVLQRIFGSAARGVGCLTMKRRREKREPGARSPCLKIPSHRPETRWQKSDTAGKTPAETFAYCVPEDPS